MTDTQIITILFSTYIFGFIFLTVLDTFISKYIWVKSGKKLESFSEQDCYLFPDGDVDVGAWVILATAWPLWVPLRLLYLLWVFLDTKVTNKLESIEKEMEAEKEIDKLTKKARAEFRLHGRTEKYDELQLELEHLYEKTYSK